MQTVKNKRNGHRAEPAPRRRGAGLAPITVTPTPPKLAEAERQDLLAAVGRLRAAEVAHNAAGQDLLATVLAVLHAHGIDPDTSGFKWNFDPNTLEITVTSKSG